MAWRVAGTSGIGAPVARPAFHERSPLARVSSKATVLPSRSCDVLAIRRHAGTARVVRHSIPPDGSPPVVARLLLGQKDNTVEFP
jgi:hypothetical protein